MADPTQTVVLDSTKALGVDKVSDCLTQDQHFIVNFVIGKIFGPGTNLDWLEAEIENIKSGDFVEPETIATMALLYARFMREFLNDLVASDLLLYYLNQQSPSQFQPTAITITPTYGFAVIPTTSVRSLKNFDNDVMIAVMTKLEEGLQSRFENPTQLFPILNYGPVQSAYFMRHDEIGIEVVPAISPLSSGGTETIYGQAYSPIGKLCTSRWSFEISTPIVCLIISLSYACHSGLKTPRIRSGLLEKNGDGHTLVRFMITSAFATHPRHQPA